MTVPAGGGVPAPGRATGAGGGFGHEIVEWLRERLGWNRIYRTTSYLRSTLWVVPILAVVAERMTFRLLQFVDRWIPWDLTGLDVDGSRALFQTLITLTLSFIVFTFGSLLVALQVASAQLTPRVIATTLLRDKVIKYSVGLNVFTLMFAVHGLNRTETVVFELSTLVAGLLGIACLASFLYFIDHAARLLRPVNIVALVSDQGMDVIRHVYPREGVEADPVSGAGQDVLHGAAARVLSHAGRSQIVLAVQFDALVAEAARVDGVIELVPQVGDFVAVDEPLVRLYGGATALDGRGPAPDRGVRARAHHGAGPDVLVPDPGGHSTEGTVARDQRPDDGGPRHRPDPPDAPVRRQAEASRLYDPRRRRPGKGDPADAELGGLRAPLVL